MGSLQVPNTVKQSEDPRKLREVSYNDIHYSIVREGLAEILTSEQPEAKPVKEDRAKNKRANDEGLKPQAVFYNPIQQYNRDLSVLAIRAFGDDFAAVRELKKQKRLLQWAQGEKRGQKRKRGADHCTEALKHTAIADHGIEQSTVKKPSTNDSNGDSQKALDTQALDDRHNIYNPRVNSVERIDEVKEDNEDTKKEMRDTGNAESIEKAANEPAEQHVNGESNTNQPGFRILDALSATGLRALRYAKEIPMATSVTANDLSAAATASIRLNVDHNGLRNKIQPATGDAIEHMHHSKARALGGSGHYHVIDLDPYGTAALFLDAAVQAVVDGGLLCVTCTDAGVFASVGYLEKTYSQYGGLPLKGFNAHEGGLRLILNAVATSAARYGLAIEPLLSLSIDFYARVFVRIHKAPVEVKFLASKTMIVYNCDAGCGAWSTQHLAQTREKQAKNGDTFYRFTSSLAPSASPECEHCGFKTHLAGPMWGGPLHNPHFIQHILDMLPSLDKDTYATIPRIEGMLSIALDETLFDPLHPPKRPSSPPRAPHTQNPTPPTSSPIKADPGPTTSHAISTSTSTFTTRPIPPTPPHLRAPHPFSIHPPTLSRTLHCVSPSTPALRGALLHLGYRCTRTHTKPGSIVTNAPWRVVWEVMREWVRQKAPVREGVCGPGTAGAGIMSKDRSRKGHQRGAERDEEPTRGEGTEVAAWKTDLVRAVGEAEDADGLKRELENALDRLNRGIPSHRTPSPGSPSSTRHREPVDTSGLAVVFDEELGKEQPGKRMVRYQVNPKDWGPIGRAKGD